MSAAVPETARVGRDGRVVADVAIVGAGVAGLYAATRLPAGLVTVVVDKGTPGRSGSSPWAQGGLAVALGDGDDAALHAADTRRAGDGLCDDAAVAALTAEAPDHVRALLDLGAELDRTADGDLHLAREGGHSVPRSAHAADATGAELVRTLRVAAAPRVRRLEGTAAALRRDRDGRVTGLEVARPDGPVTVTARAVLLATGGCGGLYAATTNQAGSTGDGLVLAAGAGAAVRDLEFVQFHPTALAVGGSRRLLLTEALRGAGAPLRDDRGRRFMPDVHADGELAPRHVVTAAILEQEGRVWLDATRLGADRLAEEFPTALEGTAEHGLDLAAEPVPVAPAAHYMVGGVRTDLHGRTSRPGLYAAGEIAATGVHGANRMAGNSLAEALVFGARAAAAIERELPPPSAREAGQPPATAAGPAAPNDDAPADPDELRPRLRSIMQSGVGPQRTADGLRQAAGELATLAGRTGPPDPAAGPARAELSLAVSAGRLIAAAAEARTESRGGHLRADHPDADPAWADVHLERTGLVRD